MERQYTVHVSITEEITGIMQSVDVNAVTDRSKAWGVNPILSLVKKCLDDGLNNVESFERKTLTMDLN